MSLTDLLEQRREAILDRWLNLILDTYPEDSTGFFRNQKNQILNPVGNTIVTEIKVLYDAIISEVDQDKLTTSLENIIKIRAVQDFMPSKAVGFIYFLKEVIREEMKGSDHLDWQSDEIHHIDSKIDELALKSFDLYNKCREKLSEIRVNEIRRSTDRILSRYTLTDFEPEENVDR